MFRLGTTSSGSIVELPQDAGTQKFAFLGQSGSGKSYGSGVFVESLLTHGRQVVIFDEVGIWYGLRLLQDGKTPSPFAIPIFGGDHADRPLTPDMGEQMAKALVHTRSCAILDVSEFTGGERSKFGAAFGEAFLLEKKKNRSPVMLVLEEAQDWVPQRPMPEENRMKGAFVRITKLGRNYGIGITFLSQRPQAVDKDALSQVECLVAFKVQEAHARKSLLDWIAEKGEDVKEHVAALPKLQKGEALLWSPAWLQRYEHVKIARKHTFDSSSTPAEVLEHTKVEAVSLDVFDRFFEEPEEEPEDEEECAQEGKPTALVHKSMYEEMERQNDHLRRELVAERDRRRQMISRLGDIALVVRGAVREIEVLLGPEAADPGPPEEVAPAMDFQATEEPRPAVFALGDEHTTHLSRAEARRQRESAPHQVSAPKKLRSGARRMLAALAGYPSGLDTPQLRMLSDLSKGGTFDTYMADLRRLQYVETRGGVHFATAQGRRHAGGLNVQVPQTTAEVLGMWKAKLRSGARRMFDEIVKRGAKGITREELIFKAQLTKGGTFDTYLADIRRTGCFEFGRGRNSVIKVRSDLHTLCQTS